MTKKGTLILWLVVIAILVIGGIVTYTLISKKRGIEASIVTQQQCNVWFNGYTDNTQKGQVVAQIRMQLGKEYPFTAGGTGCSKTSIMVQTSEWLEVGSDKFDLMGKILSGGGFSETFSVRGKKVGKPQNATISLLGYKGEQTADSLTIQVVEILPPETTTIEEPSQPLSY